MAHDVFISHSTVNKAAADAICHALESNGVRCWIAPRDIPAGSKYGEQITKGIKDCKVFLLVFSEEANNSDPVNKEVERAVLGYRKIAIPFRIEDVPMSENIEFFLSDSQWVDAVKHGEIHWRDIYPDDTVFQELVTAVKNVLGMRVESIGISHGGIELSSGQQNAYEELKNGHMVSTVDASVTYYNDEANVNIPTVYEKQPPTQNPSASSLNNLINSGRMAEDENFIYYAKYDGILYKYPIDGSGGRIELFRDSEGKNIGCINIQGDRIFFYIAEKGICRIDVDGSNFCIVKDGSDVEPGCQYYSPEEMIVLEESIILRFSKDFSPVLYRMNLDDGEIHRLSENDEKCEGFTYYNGWLYFSYKNEFDDGCIARIRPDGSERELLAEDQKANNLLLDDDYIYFFAFYDANIYRIRHDGSGREAVSTDRGNSHFNMNNDSFYYDYGWGVPDQAMYRYKKDGSSNEVIMDTDHDNGFGIYIINGMIYTIKDNVIRRMNFDGSGLEKMRM